jgi:ribosomal protein L37AE/L43A
MSDQDQPMNCPECGKPMLPNGVMLWGNFLTGKPAAPARRWDCPHCEVMVADEDIDPQWGWQQWERQNTQQSKR